MVGEGIACIRKPQSAVTPHIFCKNISVGAKTPFTWQIHLCQRLLWGRITGDEALRAALQELRAVTIE